MSSKVITNPKISVVPGMNYSIPSGCGYFRGLLLAENPVLLEYVAKHGNRIARRTAKKISRRLSLKKPNGVNNVNEANENYVNSEVAAIRLENERSNTNEAV